MDSGKDSEDWTQQQANNNEDNRFSHASRSLPLITPVMSSQSRSSHFPATQAFSDTGPITQPRPNTSRPPTVNGNGNRPESAPKVNGSCHNKSDSMKGCNGLQDFSSVENALNNALQSQEEYLVYRTSVDPAPNETEKKAETTGSPTGSQDATVYFDANDPRKSKQQVNGSVANNGGVRSSGSEGSAIYHDAEDGPIMGSDEEATGVANTKSKSRITPNMGKVYRPGMERRKRIADRPNQSMSLWSILKNSLGKDLSKISMPVNFSEPLSMLQRLSEDYEYSHILDTAAACTDSTLQMCHVAAFTVSSYGTTAVRTAKPFNPLLGETFECDRREDRGWRCISEQVSHHPPTAALYCEGKGWTCWQDFTMSSKFRGNSLEIVPLGIAHLKFTESDNHYTWRKVTTVVHNIVLGKLWVDQVGEMVIKNLKTGDTCQLKYHPTTYFGKHPKQVTGNVSTSRGVTKWHLIGSWDEKLIATPATTKSGEKPSESKSTKTLSAFGGSGTLNLWNIRLPTPGAEKYYDFTEFACQLNEPEIGVAPTDSRLRPDQRLMEDGRWDEANNEKQRLEEKQRAAKKKREAEAGGSQNDTYEPIWFIREFDPSTATKMFRYSQEYWDAKQKKDWKKCPNIF